MSVTDWPYYHLLSFVQLQDASVRLQVCTIDPFDNIGLDASTFYILIALTLRKHITSPVVFHIGRTQYG